MRILHRTRNKQFIEKASDIIRYYRKIQTSRSSCSNARQLFAVKTRIKENRSRIFVTLYGYFSWINWKMEYDY